MNKQYRRATKRSKDSVQLALSAGERVAMLQEELHAFAVEAMLDMAKELMADEVRRLCGEEYERVPERERSRHGHQRGTITVAGQRQRIVRPRARTRDGKEVVLESYRQLSDPAAMSFAVLKRAVRGVSTRNYSQVIDAFTEGYGVSSSSVSRAFVRGSEEALKRLCARHFDGRRFIVIVIDGVEYEGTTIMVALGIESCGKKTILGLREGASENAEVVKGLLADLRERGVNCEKTTLFVLDGSKALAKGVRDVFGERAVIQRCRIHKKRNIRAHLPEQYWSDLDKRLAAAWHEDRPYQEALKILKTTAKWLDRICPDAAASLREGMEETVTVNALGVKGALRETLSCTNVIESAFSVTRSVTARVKRWRPGSMRLRWCASGLLHAETKFRRVRGYAAIPSLIKTLEQSRELDQLRKAA